MLQKSPDQLPDKPRRQWLWWAGGAVAVVSIGVVALGAWIVSSPSFPAWTQFGIKGLWDLLELLVQLLGVLAVPIVLAVVGFRVSAQQQKRIAEAQDAEQLLALDDQREKALQDYMDRMTELLLKEEFSVSQMKVAVKAVVNARTHAVLRRLNSDRKTILMKFLLDAKLVGGKRPVIGLQHAELQEVNIRNIVLKETDMTNIYLTGAKLAVADFMEAELPEADLTKADLSGADLRRANLSGADLSEANLTGADFRGADLSKADLTGADLRGAFLSGADLTEATITDTILPEGFVPPTDARGIPKWVDEPTE